MKENGLANTCLWQNEPQYIVKVMADSYSMGKNLKTDVLFLSYDSLSCHFSISTSAKKITIYHILGWEVSLIIGPDTLFTRIGSVFANKPRDYIYLEGKCPCCKSRILQLLGWKVSFIIWLDNLFVRMISVLYFSDALLAGVEEFL